MRKHFRGLQTVIFIFSAWRHREYFITSQLDFYTKYCGYISFINIYICVFNSPLSTHAHVSFFLMLSQTLHFKLVSIHFLLFVYVYILSFYLRDTLCWIISLTDYLNINFMRISGILRNSWANKKNPSRNLSIIILHQKRKCDNIDHKSNLEFRCKKKK